MMISVQDLCYRFPEAASDALAGVIWNAPAGSFTLIAGQSGSGKSTLLRCLNGLIPHFHGGHFGGSVVVDRQDTRHATPRDLARVIGTVFQEPEAQLVTDSVEDEIEFALENLGFERAEIRHRSSWIRERLGIDHLRSRRISTLSGGERQIVAIAAALAPGPRAIILDEPTSQLDPRATSAILALLEDLHRRDGLTIILAEHRLARLRDRARSVLHLRGGLATSGTPAEVWPDLVLNGLADDPAVTRVHPECPTPGERMVEIRDLSFSYHSRAALDGIDLDLAAGEVVALMGPNGSGKTTLLKHLIGLLRPDAGFIRINGEEMTNRPVHEIAGLVGYVPQQPSLILHRETVREELAFTLASLKRTGDIEAIFDLLDISDLAGRHPLDLSGGERQRAAIAAIAVGEPRVLLLDEPTRGLPLSDKLRLAGSLRRYAGGDRLVVVATHDAEFAAALGQRTLRIESGSIVGDDPPEDLPEGQPRAAIRSNQRSQPALTASKPD